ncbi:TPA: ribonuclease Y [Candidatus Collierbacteria bacterium]|uniref:Ribonuclease Y n=2 Tax=Candidatus Collieribacteriota TaxID=1752725 RepID=A0A1F5FXE8_9BACT|nr:MAG: Ribonuclease Y [Microgenomates group bacterium GW2011_GWF1_46_12]KKU28279.1 MAG: Ribonuclease Y [Microgenomates group bacterium GW2011_GWF2_46_18]KKU44124.1 MAG: Ribonuclease Y [Microgenomates group bacterium GW2011_GWA1_46_7]KKU45502.1 MAG: Ribonuclease Y [Microgenomates group bacterium GW2011_GWB1_46_7]KKU62096.1 MAG: Ribonuclease Y [Microgenomates group bacterium GW2011_GWE1_47_12]OGD70136.1 MAG: ribonuclease Y [Candidatus Collierbacteria bacterium RIFOXYA1_FULL_46_24]OGD75538.1 MA
MSLLLKSLLNTFKAKKVSVSKPKIKPLVAKKVTSPSAPASHSTQESTKQAETAAREIITFAREEADKIRASAKVEMDALQSSLQGLQHKLEQESRDLNTRISEINRREENIILKQTEIDKLKHDIEELKVKQVEKLEKIGSLTRDKAKEILLEAVDKKLTRDVAERIRSAEDEMKEAVDQKSRDLLIDAMYHGATEYVAEFTVSTVKIADDEVKGRIIGKDGRNIRTFEKVTGVDIDMDETPGVIRLSCYDGVRREVARVALERLIKDGRIQPSRIEEYVAKAHRDIEKIMFEEGKHLCHAVGAYNVPHDLITLLGHFKYRSSYGQNMLGHTLEETRIGMKLAAEVKANVDVVRLGCLFHDIGKIITGEEGSHIELGVKLLQKYNLPKEVINCVAEHHEDQEFSSKESILVYISDAISGSRPGARYENIDEYVKRLTAIEEIALSKPGVTEAYAISAGREVRVMVDPGKATDDEATRLASDIRDEIKAKVTYPGTVTVTVIRELRTQQVAK